MKFLHPLALGLALLYFAGSATAQSEDCTEIGQVASAQGNVRLLGADPWLRSIALVSRGLGLKVRRGPRARAGRWSEAEARIASLVREGFSNRQIATSLHYSVKTVETYLTHIYTKTGASNRDMARGLARPPSRPQGMNLLRA